jgi:hypothetical protein
MELAKGSHRKLYKAIDFSDEKPVNKLIENFALALEELHIGQCQYTYMWKLKINHIYVETQNIEKSCRKNLLENY